MQEVLSGPKERPEKKRRRRVLKIEKNSARSRNRKKILPGENEVFMHKDKKKGGENASGEITTLSEKPSGTFFCATAFIFQQK